MRVLNDGGEVVCDHCLVADTVWKRMKGLLGRRELPAGEGLLIRPTWSIHMFFMRFPIDAVFLDADDTVVRVAAGLEPWRTASQRGAKAVLELAAGECRRRGIGEGQHLRLVEP